MKTYKKVEVVAKNATSGSYVAGCPTNMHKFQGDTSSCRPCEIAR